MLHEGPLVKSFARQGADLQQEFSICQRYFHTWGRFANNQPVSLSGQWVTNVQAATPYRFPVEMRVAPSFSAGSAFSDFAAIDAAGVGKPVTNLLQNVAYPALADIRFIIGTTTTIGSAASIQTANGNAFMNWDAEIQ